MEHVQKSIEQFPNILYINILITHCAKQYFWQFFCVAMITYDWYYPYVSYSYVNIVSYL